MYIKLRYNTMTAKITAFIFTIIFCFIFTYNGIAQIKLPEDVKEQIKNYEINAMKNRNAGNDNAAAGYLNKMSFIYWEYFDYANAVKCFEEVLAININLGNKNGEQKVLENIAMVYSDMERYDKSIEYFNRSLTLIKTKGDKQQICSGINNLTVALSSNANYKEAIEKAEEGLSLSKSINDVKLMRSFYGVLYECYDKLGNKEKSIENFNLYTSLDKHIQQQLFAERDQQNKQLLSEMESAKDKALEEKKEKEEELKSTKDTLEIATQLTSQQQLEIENLNQQKAIRDLTIKEQEAKLRSERIIRFGLISVFLLISVFSVLLYREMKAKNKAHNELRDLYAEVDKKNQQILDSIKYASHIQEAILPYEKSLKEQLPGSFVFYQPRDIVSGDFYWYSIHGDKVFIAAIDCTGHGVPGAFMSMIGNTLLNEIVNEAQIFEPEQVLKMLNEKVVNTLNQENKEQEAFSEDGMDITFVCYNKTTKTVTMALANHSACVIRNGNREIIEGDIYSIGGNVGNFSISFTNHVIPIDTETTIYMFSDGFADQYGGLANQKYKTTRFMQFLTQIQTFSFDKHQSIIEREFNDWKGDNKQIDDVLVIGLKFLV